MPPDEYTQLTTICNFEVGWGQGRRSGWVRRIGLELLLEQNDALLDRTTANRAADNLVAAHLARSVSAQEHHVLFAVEADRTNGLKCDAQGKTKNRSSQICCKSKTRINGCTVSPVPWSLAVPAAVSGRHANCWIRLGRPVPWRRLRQPHFDYSFRHHSRHLGQPAIGWAVTNYPCRRTTAGSIQF